MQATATIPEQLMSRHAVPKAHLLFESGVDTRLYSTVRPGGMNIKSCLREHLRGGLHSQPGPK